AGLVAEVAPSRGEIGSAVADVARPVCNEIGLRLDAKDATEDLKQIEQAVRHAAGDVEGVPGAHTRGSTRRREIGVHDVADEREVPALLAVAVDGGRAPGGERVDEQGNDSGVRRVGPLSWAIDVEGAEAHGLET